MLAIPRARGLVVAALVFGAGLVAAPVEAQPVPAGYSYSHGWFDSFDGTQLHAGVFLPSNRTPEEKHPVILVSTPYTSPNGGSGGPNLTGPMVRFPELFTRPSFKDGRYAYVQVDVRGFGGSEGCFEYYMPNEQKDVKVAVQWAAAQPWSTGKVGMWGKSYDAAQQVLALGSDPSGLAASVIQSPGLSAYTALWMNGVHYATGRYATTGAYTADDLLAPQNQDTIGSPEYAAAAASPVTSIPGNPTCRADAIAGMNAIRDRDDPFWQAKEAYWLAAGSDVPVFWSHGFYDANTKPVHMDIWESLTGPNQAWFGQYTHLRGHENGVGRDGFLDEAFRFLDEHMRGIEPATADPTVTVQEGSRDGLWRAEEQWPPTDAQTWSMPLRAGSYVDEPGNTAGGSSAGQGLWAVTPPIPNAAHLAGESALTVALATAVPNVNLVAHLYDIDDSGRATFVQRGAMAPEAMGAQQVSFRLYPQDWYFEAGHRIGILLSGSDDDWFSPGVSQTTVQVTGGRLELPLLRYIRDEFLDGGASDGMSAEAAFNVPAATLQSATVQSEPPPAQQPRPEP
ncbi:MAG: CocE/NonD family hydrolase [Actinomycetota bacterium]